jgi:hypothetical protein
MGNVVHSTTIAVAPQVTVATAVKKASGSVEIWSLLQLPRVRRLLHPTPLPLLPASLPQNLQSLHLSQHLPRPEPPLRRLLCLHSKPLRLRLPSRPADPPRHPDRPALEPLLAPVDLVVLVPLPVLAVLARPLLLELLGALLDRAALAGLLLLELLEVPGLAALVRLQDHRPPRRNLLLLPHRPLASPQVQHLHQRATERSLECVERLVVDLIALDISSANAAVNSACVAVVRSSVEADASVHMASVISVWKRSGIQHFWVTNRIDLMMQNNISIQSHICSRVSWLLHSLLFLL